MIEKILILMPYIISFIFCVIAWVFIFKKIIFYIKTRIKDREYFLDFLGKELKSKPNQENKKSKLYEK